MSANRDSDLTPEDRIEWELFCKSANLPLSRTDTRNDQSGLGRSSVPANGSDRSSITDEALSQLDRADWKAYAAGKDLSEIKIVNQLETTREKPSGNVSKRESNNHRAVELQKQENQKNSRPTVDKTVLKRLNRGDMNPENHLDLHGLTSSEAASKVTQFIFSSYRAGKRLILVIPGKGKDPKGGSGFGVLNRLVPQLAKSAKLASIILHYQTAHTRHGGTGAYYIYLKKFGNSRKRLS